MASNVKVQRGSDQGIRPLSSIMSLYNDLVSSWKSTSYVHICKLQCSLVTYEHEYIDDRLYETPCID